jgi:hypothetical protein
MPESIPAGIEALNRLGTPFMSTNCGTQHFSKELLRTTLIGIYHPYRIATAGIFDREERQVGSRTLEGEYPSA